MYTRLSWWWLQIQKIVWSSSSFYTMYLYLSKFKSVNLSVCFDPKPPVSKPEVKTCNPIDGINGNEGNDEDCPSDQKCYRGICDSGFGGCE